MNFNIVLAFAICILYVSLCVESKGSSSDSSSSPALRHRKCRKGTYSPTGYPKCRNCPPGTYNNRRGMKYCPPCPKGQYQPKSGRRKCKRCPRNQTTPRPGATSRKDCKHPGGGNGEPHIIIPSDEHNMCFNFHGKDGEIFDLVTDHMNDLYVRGRTFEVNVPSVSFPLSYFADIGISFKGNHIVFEREVFMVNNNRYDYNYTERIESGPIQITREQGELYKCLIELDDKIYLEVARSYSAEAGPFLGFYLISMDEMSQTTGGIIGQFAHTKFEIEELPDTADGIYTHKLVFNDHHKSTHVMDSAQYSTTHGGKVACYFCNSDSRRNLIGDTDTYRENTLIV